MLKPIEGDPAFTVITKAFAKGLTVFLQQEGSNLEFILFVCDPPDLSAPINLRLAYASSMDSDVALHLLESFVAASQLQREQEGAGHA